MHVQSCCFAFFDVLVAVAVVVAKAPQSHVPLWLHDEQGRTSILDSGRSHRGVRLKKR